ncbi:MAG: amino acid kinase family protein [Candidatus Karelsulcia muelleri]
MINVVKLGGDIIFNKKLLISSLKNFSKLDGYKIIVHGGGKIADLVSKKMGYNIKIINGRRITDKTTLEIVVMTYSGLINKKIVSKLQSLGLNPIGFNPRLCNFETIFLFIRPEYARDGFSHPMIVIFVTFYFHIS